MTETKAQAELTATASILELHADNIADENVQAYLPQDWDAFRMDLLHAAAQMRYVRDNLIPSIVGRPLGRA